MAISDQAVEIVAEAMYNHRPQKTDPEHWKTPWAEVPESWKKKQREAALAILEEAKPDIRRWFSIEDSAASDSAKVVFVTPKKQYLVERFAFGSWTPISEWVDYDDAVEAAIEVRSNSFPCYARVVDTTYNDYEVSDTYLGEQE